MTIGASSSTHSEAGSGIDLNIIDFFDLLSESYMDIISEVMEELMEEQETNLRERAAGNDAWAALADKIEVQYDGKFVDYRINGTPEDHASFSKKEYGDLFQAPRPLMRSFASRHTNELADKFTQKMRKALGETL